MEIFCDMDLVLVDFLTGAAAVHGLSFAEMDARFGAAHPVTGIIWSGSGFTAPIEEDPHFWTRLRPLPWAADLVHLLDSFDPHWHLLSSPLKKGDGNWCQGCYDGKVKWIHNYFGCGFDRFLLTPHKYKLAKPDAVLIDDLQSNCEHFITNPKTGRETGGDAILFPHYRNINSDLAHDPLPYVHEKLLEIRRQYDVPVEVA